eukprot:2365214-Prymnesium_polylepis.1
MADASIVDSTEAHPGRATAATIHRRLLLLNLVAYVTDNVLVLMLASSIAMVAVTIVGKSELNSVLVAALGVAAAILIVLALRSMVMCVHMSSGAKGQAIAHHALRQLSWFVRIAFQAFTSSLLASISDHLSDTESDPCR